MNMMDYVKYYGNKTFDEVPLNEVDALIFSCLGYLNFDGIIKRTPIKLYDLAVIYFAKITKEELKNQINVGKLYSNCYYLFKALKDSKRYRDLIISDYQKYVDKETQFGTIVFRHKKFLFIAFEGTNTYMSGWREDANMSHQFPVYSHVLAKETIENNVNLFDKNVYLGGHSKGGNLSVVGAMLSNSSIKKKIKKIYDFDGPGVRIQEFKSNNYELIAPKINKFVPNQSMVGMLLNSVAIFKVVKSSSKVILQHDPFSWKCYGSFFVEDKLSNESINFKKEMEEFVNFYPKEGMEELVNVIFDIFESAKIEKTRGISFSQIAKTTKYIREMTIDQSVKEKITKIVNIIINYINKK